MGRARELEELLGALALAMDGSPQVVLILGPGGIGKSALVRETASRSGIPLRVGACLPLGAGDVPYLPFIELLRGMVATFPPEELLPILGRARSEVARLLPELGPVARREEDPGLARAVLFEQLRGVAERLGTRTPRILAVEDLQWADGSTRDLLLFLARNVRSARLLLLLTCRTDDLPPGHPFPAFAAELERGANVRRVELTGLARGEVAEQAAATLGRPLPAAAVDRLYARTEGNPLFLEELLATVDPDADERVLVDADVPLPPRLRDALSVRLGALSPDARRLAGLAAVAGRHGDAHALETLWRVGPDRLEAALRETIDAGVLAPDPAARGGDGVRFHHALLREVAQAGLLPGERARAHEAMAARLAEGGGGPELLAEVAGHWIAAGVEDRALAASVTAGLAAGAAIAPAESLAHLERALARWDRVDGAAEVAGMDRVALLQRVADAAARSGAPDRAVAATREALALVDADADAARTADLRRSLRWFLWSAGDPVGALAEAEAAAMLLASGGPSLVRANTLAHLAGLRLVLGDASRAAATARDALDEARAVGAASEEALAVGVLGLAELRLGDPDAGLAHVRDAWARSLALGHVSGVALAYDQLAGALARLGRAAEAAELARDGIAVAGRLGLDRTFGVRLRASAAEALLELGRWAEAGELIAEGLAGEPSGTEGVAIHVAAARLAVGTGQVVGAAASLATARRLAAGMRSGPAGDGAMVGARVDGPGWPGTVAAVELARASGRPDEARQAATAGLAAPVGLPAGDKATLVRLGLRAEADLALAARVRGDRAGVEAARGRAAGLLAAAHAPWPGAPTEVAHATRLAAAAAAARLDGAVPAHHWEAVMRAWQAAGRPVHAAEAAVHAIEACLRDGDRALAAMLAGDGLALARAAGAVPLVDAIRDLARRARLDLERVSDDADGSSAGVVVPAPSGLTPRELEVLALLAEGRTNREIGEALFISPKTVSVHVTNLLGKLGAAGRVEAATTAIRLGLVRTR